MIKWGLSSGTPADSYYEVRSDCTDGVPKSKFKIKVWVFYLRMSVCLLFHSVSINFDCGVIVFDGIAIWPLYTFSFGPCSICVIKET
jgi:hypothetical protein